MENKEVTTQVNDTQICYDLRTSLLLTLKNNFCVQRSRNQTLALIGKIHINFHAMESHKRDLFLQKNKFFESEKRLCLLIKFNNYFST